MEHLNPIVQMYFQKVSSKNILEGKLDYSNFSKEDFDALALGNMQYLSESETGEIYLYLSSIVGAGSGENGLNVFRALKELSKGLLLIRENEPICRYEKLLQWRELTRCTGEDLPICAFLAYRTERTGYYWQDFEWNTVIGHDNMQLNRIMQKGLSDNHFHLYGSAPTFKLIWIRLMNGLNNAFFLQSLQNIDRKKRVFRQNYTKKFQEESLEIMHFQAALIRLSLFYYITMQKRKEAREAAKILENKERIQRILTDERLLLLYANKIQIAIEQMRDMKALFYDDKTMDYANLGYQAKSVNHEFEGERALIYQMLLGKIENKLIPDFLMRWFYAYLAIQAKLREELVQVNQNVGFENFKEYNKRKSGFLFTDEDDRRMVQHAALGTLEPGNIRSLELRITPGKTAVKNRDIIRLYDSYIGEKAPEDLSNIYYVFHFPKRQDRELKQKLPVTNICRHDAFRWELERIAENLISFRENAPKEAARVLGIDACSQEIGCRPEVFAPVFRRLAGHVVNASIFPSNVRQWKITYHVGEDFMDFVDGLRAIDEAVLFFNMKNGDRLGHATALGLNVKKWYSKKRKNICLPLQDYLDNVVWLYEKLIAFHIKDCESLKGYLHSEYEKCFRVLYQEQMAREGQHSIGIDTYYEAWKLRGDHPKLYKKRRFSDADSMFRRHWVNDFLDGGEENRKRNETALLMFYYHYSVVVRNRGKQAKSVVVPDAYIEGVCKIQKAMQQFIADRGIGIEANPSSNYFISTMDSYEEHPISSLYNLGLETEPEKIRACTQMHVSINTDDKGVFQTSLENEFALMGCALERATDEAGNKKYPKQMVYDWLDHIRENGRQQSFLT